MWAGVDRRCSEFSHVRPDMVQSRLARKRTSSARNRPNLAQNRSKLTTLCLAYFKFGPTSAKVGQTSDNFDQHRGWSNGGRQEATRQLLTRLLTTPAVALSSPVYGSVPQRPPGDQIHRVALCRLSMLSLKSVPERPFPAGPGKSGSLGKLL